MSSQSQTISHDAAYKLLFSFPVMVRDLLVGFVPHDWVAELDLSTLERWSDSRVSDDLRQRHQDRVWRVRFRGQWLYVLVLLEFQSSVDRSMAVRILAYTALLYQDLLRAGAGSLPAVFPGGIGGRRRRRCRTCWHRSGPCSRPFSRRSDISCWM